MSLQQYFDDFCRGLWAENDARRCLCGGHGWALSDLDTWHKCPVHYAGQQHPEDYSDDLLDEPEPAQRVSATQGERDGQDDDDLPF